MIAASESAPAKLRAADAAASGVGGLQLMAFGVIVYG